MIPTALPLQPLLLTRGRGTYLYDQDGNCYLDCVNNVAHVGHCHPVVSSAVADQMHLLNTNSRYLSKSLTDYVEQLVDTLPAQLKVSTGCLGCSFCCKGGYDA